jgi:hypothetical protein
MLSENLLLRIARACYAACNSWDTDHNPDAEMPVWDDTDDAVKESILTRINKILRDPRVPVTRPSTTSGWMRSARKAGPAVGNSTSPARWTRCACRSISCRRRCRLVSACSAPSP